MDNAVKTPATWGRWDKKRYHELIKQIKAPVLLMAGGDEDLMGIDAASLGEDVKRIPNARDFKIFPGFSHWIFFEHADGESGLSLVVSAILDFHASLGTVPSY